MIYTFLQIAVRIIEDSILSWDSILSSMIGAGSALLIFYMTIRLEKNRQLKKAFIESKNRVEYLNYLLKSVIDKSFIQLRLLNDSTKSINDSPMSTSSIKRVTQTDVKRLTNVLIENEYYTSFIEVYSSKLNAPNYYNSIFSYADILNELYNSLNELLSSSYVEQVKMTHDLQNLTGECIKYLNSYLMQYKGVPEAKSHPLEIISSSFKANLNDTSNYNNYHDNFINPIKDYFRDFIYASPGPVADSVLSIFHKFKDTSSMYTQLKDSKLLLSKKIDELSIGIGDAAINLRKLHNDISGI